MTQWLKGSLTVTDPETGKCMTVMGNFCVGWDPDAPGSDQMQLIAESVSTDIPLPIKWEEKLTSSEKAFKETILYKKGVSMLEEFLEHDSQPLMAEGILNDWHISGLESKVQDALINGTLAASTYNTHKGSDLPHLASMLKQLSDIVKDQAALGISTHVAAAQKKSFLSSKNSLHKTKVSVDWDHSPLNMLDNGKYGAVHLVVPVFLDHMEYYSHPVMLKDKHVAMLHSASGPGVVFNPKDLWDKI